MKHDELIYERRVNAYSIYIELKFPLHCNVQDFVISYLLLIENN